MRAAAALPSIEPTLAQWLRLLWDIAPPLCLDSDRPHIAAGSIHLPARAQWQDHAAAAAHAAAHLVHSPRVFDGDGLGAIVRALMGLLEDARVETLAVHELPGLARLWRRWHVATPALGDGFEALMQRLARALSDPDYADPHPWVCKGMALFYRPDHRGWPALQTPADVRSAAIRLGHDIGQMRLQFNAKTYSPMPAYRDDHRWMWPADVQRLAPPPAGVTAALPDDDDDRAPALTATETRHPEWDRLIARLRPGWCHVFEQRMPLPALPPAAMDGAIAQVALRLRRSLAALTRQADRPRPSEEGEWLELSALVDWRIARRMRNAPAPRVYRGLGRRSAATAAWLLVDHSASTAAVQGTDGQDILHMAAISAAATAAALQKVGVACAVSGFSSEGRKAVRISTVKSFGETVGDHTLARLLALRPRGSTRLGAALRHATARLMEQGHDARWVIVLSDGEPHDVDVHDPRYLVEDARHAVKAAARSGVRTMCLVLAPDGGMARRIFGRAGVQLLRNLDDLPRVISRLAG